MSNEIFHINSEQDRRQPYRADLRAYLSAFHGRIVPQDQAHNEEHKKVDTAERNAATILAASDKAAQLTSRPDYASVIRRQKIERGPSAVGLSVCIDGRMPLIIVAGPGINAVEAKAGLIPTANSPLDGTPEIASARLTEAIIDRPSKDNSELVQINTLHGDLSKGESFAPEATEFDLDCAALLQLISRGVLPKDQPVARFRQMLDQSGEAIGTHYNNSAKLAGKDSLAKVSLTCFYDTRTAGFLFGETRQDSLFTTDLTKAIIKSDDFEMIRSIALPDMYRRTFTEPETITSRENLMVDIEHALLTRSQVFGDVVNNYLESNIYGEFTQNQLRAIKFFIARNVAMQYTTGLYHGGDHPLAAHNEQYISFSSDGLRVGQFDTKIQSFGATVSNHADTLDHLKTKVGLMDHIGKSKPPYIAFLNKSQPERTSISSERNTRAELRSTMQVIYQDQELLPRIKAGELIVIPVVLQEKTGVVKSIPNLAI